MDLGLAGRRAIVTGGSKGLGKAIAAELLAEGAAVVDLLPARRRAGGDSGRAGQGSSRRSARAGPRRGHAVRRDRPGPGAAFTDAAAAALGGLDILVNNAGGARPGQFGTLTDDDWHADIEVKLFSQIRCTRSALPHLRRSAAPRVININAVYARYPDPAFLASSVNRASCLSLSKALSMELGRRGNPGQQREHRLRRDAAVAEHPPPPRTGDAGRAVLRPARGRLRCRSAGSAGPTRSPGWSRSWPATGPATSPARRSTSAGGWANSSRNGVGVCRLLGYCSAC